MSALYLKRKDDHTLAYYKNMGCEPTVIFLSGFKSDMQGTKALMLEALCHSKGWCFVRFDYSGHGESSGLFKEGTIGTWKNDALDIITELGGQNNILVGSSMGAWLALLVALEMPEKVAGLMGIASAPDFTERLMWDRFTAAQKQEILSNGVYDAPSVYGDDPYPITLRLIEEGRTHLLLDKPIALHCPVRLLHGTHDEDVPWQFSVRLMETITSNDVRLSLIKGAGHRLSEPEHLQLIASTLEELYQRLEII